MLSHKAVPASKVASNGIGVPKDYKKKSDNGDSELSAQKSTTRRRNSNAKKEIVGSRKSSPKVARKRVATTTPEEPSAPNLQQDRDASASAFTIKVKPLFCVQKQNEAVRHASDRKMRSATFSATEDEEEEDETKRPCHSRVDTAFHWDADAVSEREIIESLETLNSLIVNLVAPLVESVADWRFKNTGRTTQKLADALQVLADKASTLGSVQQIYERLITDDGIDKKKRSLLEEGILFDRIGCLLYEEYFEGRYFFGSGFSNDLKAILDPLFDDIVKDQPWPIALRWRSITATSRRSSEASRLTPMDIKAALKVAFKMCHPFKSGIFHKKFNDTLYSNEMSMLVVSILEVAKNLSLSLQKDVVSALVRVTIAPRNERNNSGSGRRYQKADPRVCQSAWSDLEMNEGDQVLGTCRLGLERVYGHTERGTPLICPRVITDKIFTLCT